MNDEMDIKSLTPLKNSDVPYPFLWIGTWSMAGVGYGRADERLCKKTLEIAYDFGIRHFDTANFYGRGRAEEIIAKCFSPKRTSCFISSKGGLIWQGKKVLHRGRPEDLKKQLEISLKTLKTDYLDLYQLHWSDPEVDVKESIDALRDLKKMGLIRFYGAGNLNIFHIQKAVKEKEFIPFQLPFNPLRIKKLEIFRFGKKTGRTINLSVSPFEQGLLIDPRFLKNSPGKKDIRSRNPFFKEPSLKPYINKLFSLAEKCPISTVSIIILYILGFDDIDGVIPGPRTPDQIKDIIECINLIEKNNLKKNALHGFLKGLSKGMIWNGLKRLEEISKKIPTQ